MSISLSSEVERWTAGVLIATAVLTEKKEADIIKRQDGGG